ncbi:MAG: CARDB domain-containing protein [Vulcanimicrobiota bacterium]
MRKTWMTLLSLAALSLNGWGRPRLEAASHNWTGELKPGGQLIFSVRAVNRSKETSRGVLCSVYLQGKKIGQAFSNADLPAQGEVLLEGNCSLPADLAAEVQKRSADQVLTLQLQPYRVPDLSPADIAVEQTTEGLRWTVTVVNKGQAPAAAVPYQLFWDGRAIAQKKALQAVGAGDSYQFVYQDKRPVESGKHKLSCWVDPTGEIEDADTSNNQYALDWQANASKPDLVTRGLTLEPEAAVVGTPVRVMFELANTGEVEMFKLPVSLKVNDKIEVEKKFFQSLPPGAETNLTLTWVPSQAGQQRLTIICQGAASQAKIVEVAGRPGYKFGAFKVDVPKRSRQGKDWIFNTNFKNVGTLPCDSVRAVLWADGTRVWSARLDQPLQPGQEANLDLRWSAEKPGRHELRIDISAQGAKADDSADIRNTYQVEVEPANE